MATRRAEPVVLCHSGKRGAPATSPVQPQASCQRARHRLPILPHRSGAKRIRRYSVNVNLHELPFADLDQQSDARTGARKLPHRSTPALDPGSQPGGVCLFQSQHPCEQGRRLRDLSWRGRSDAAGCPRKIAADGMVPGLSSQSRAVPPPREEVFNMSWTAPANQSELGMELVRKYNVRTEQLTDCSVCHR